jgi:hypothetical protein
MFRTGYAISITRIAAAMTAVIHNATLAFEEVGAIISSAKDARTIAV